MNKLAETRWMDSFFLQEQSCYVTTTIAFLWRNHSFALMLELFEWGPGNEFADFLFINILGFHKTSFDPFCLSIQAYLNCNGIKWVSNEYCSPSIYLLGILPVLRSGGSKSQIVSGSNAISNSWRKKVMTWIKIWIQNNSRNLLDLLLLSKKNFMMPCYTIGGTKETILLTIPAQLSKRIWAFSLPNYCLQNYEKEYWLDWKSTEQFHWMKRKGYLEFMQTLVRFSKR